MSAISSGPGFQDGASVDRWVAEAIGHTPFDHYAEAPEEPWTRIVALWDRHDDHLHSSAGPLCVPGVSPPVRRVDLVGGVRRKRGPRVSFMPTHLIGVQFPSGLVVAVENWAVAHHRECDEPTCTLIWHRAGTSQDLWRVWLDDEEFLLVDRETAAIKWDVLPDSPQVQTLWNELIPVEQVTPAQCRESQISRWSSPDDPASP